MVRQRVTVIIVNWHSERMLEQALSALDQQTVLPDEVVIVDNGSEANLPLEKFSGGSVTVISMPYNVGFAAGNNRAIFSACQTEWVALLNPDAIPAAGWLERLLHAAEANPEFSAFGSVQVMAERPELLDGMGDVYHVCGAAWRSGHAQPIDHTIPIDTEIFCPCAAAALYRRSALVDVGGFDEDFFCYFEDVDLGFRLRLLGYRSMLASEARVLHVGGGSSGGQQSDFSVFHGHRNLVWAYVKNMPGWYFWWYLPQHLLFNAVSILYFVLTGQGRVILKAKWAAVVGIPAMMKKRRRTQMDVRTADSSVVSVMARGLLDPYRRR
jgi:GT2 family glycosyltransferase